MKLLKLLQQCWVRRAGPIAWCGRSCDVTLLDIFWSNITEHIYTYIYRVFHDLGTLLQYVFVIKIVHLNTCPILNGYRVKAFFNSRTRPRINWVMYWTWWLIIRVASIICHLTRPPSYRQSSFHISTLVRCLRNAGMVGGWVFALPVYTAWVSYYYVFKNPCHLHYSDCAGSWCAEQYGDSFVKAWAVEVTV